MKRIIYITVLCLFIITCKRSTQEYISLVGHLEGSNTKELSFVSGNLMYKIPVDNAGNFFLRVTADNPRYYKLDINDGNKLSLFLIPGDSLIINKKGEKYEFLGGESAILSNYYIEWESYINEFFKSVDVKKYYAKESFDFQTTNDQYLDMSKKPLKELTDAHPNINPEFLYLENERLKYYFLIDFIVYKFNHSSVTGEMPKEPLSDYMKKVNLNDSRLLQLETYQDFLLTYVDMEAKGKIFQINSGNYNYQIERSSLTSASIQFVCKEFKKEVKDFLLYKIAYSKANSIRLDDKLLALFEKECKNEDYIQIVKHRYNELKKLSPGNVAPDFILYDADDKQYKLSDFKGKYILMNIWQAHSASCILEIQKLKNIRSGYEGKDIEFIGVNIDESKTDWLDKVKELGMSGLQLNVHPSDTSQFRKNYIIEKDGIPAFVMVGRDGKIIDAKAPKPSENLNDLLDFTLTGL
jgi:peroxiredoxin